MTLSEVNYPVVNGRYKHYKGGMYRVLFLSKHTETGETMVNYKSELFGSFFTRPLDSWNSRTEDNKIRFEYIERCPVTVHVTSPAEYPG
jgi:hypothetical protein